MIAFVRADASPALGGGHVMRCLALAGALRAKGCVCVFAVSPETGLAVPALAASGHKVLVLDQPGDPTALQAAAPAGCDLLVIDHYGLDAAYEAALLGWARRIAAFDDAPNRLHAADVLIDSNNKAAEMAYRGQAGFSCRLLLGPDYAPLRTEFASWRERALARRAYGTAPKRILVSFGLTDPTHLTERALMALMNLEADWAIDIVLGSQAPGRAQVEALAAGMGSGAQIHFDVADMAERMALADLALGAAGSSAWERCALGLPSVAVMAVANQEPVAAVLRRAGAACILPGDVSADDMAREVSALLANPSALQTMAGVAAALCDGAGAARIADALLDFGAEKISP